MLCIWWNFRGVIHFELLPTNQTVTSEVYFHQLDRLNQSLIQKEPTLIKRKFVILQHDNARPHIAGITIEKLKQFGWEVLPHPPYSPDIAPSDYYLFRSLQNFLNGKKFHNEEALKSNISNFFQSKPKEFYKRGINALPKRWTEVVEKDGLYIID